MTILLLAVERETIVALLKRRSEKMNEKANT